MNLKPLIFPLVAAVLGLAPVTSQADSKVKVYRDRDGDGHYNKKTYDVSKYRDRRADYYRHNHNYGYYGGPGYYRGYGYPYRSGYYSYPRTAVGVSIYSRPSYSRSYNYSDSLASDIQRSLKRRGYYFGSVDGDVGPGTRSAIRAYQRDHGLAITGRIDSALVRSLD